jgi:hypothetical protein
MRISSSLPSAYDCMAQAYELVTKGPSWIMGNHLSLRVRSTYRTILSAGVAVVAIAILSQIKRQNPTHSTSIPISSRVFGLSIAATVTIITFLVLFIIKFNRRSTGPKE